MSEVLPATYPVQWLGILAPLAASLPVLYALYQYLLPKPIPGIPYNKEATKSLFGDIARIQKESPSRVFGWIIENARKHASPIYQIWLGPFQKPTVVITDFREGQDILMRRKEFDRSDFFANVLSGEARSFHITMKTGPQWKSQRRILQDLMTPAFLNRVAAPNIYKSVSRMLELWKKKEELAEGRAFSAENDIFCAALDAVFDFGFGDAATMRALIPQNERIMSLSDSDIQRLRGEAVDGKAIDFPVAPIHPAMEATLQTAENITGVAATGVPKLAWLVMGLMPSVRRGRAARDDFLVDQIHKAVERYNLQGRDQGDKNVKSAIDLMVQRQRGLAEKEGHLPANWLETLRDESVGFVVAGHDTTSTTLCWGIKYLSDNPDIQQRLLDSLRGAHSAAFAEERLPTDGEITSASIPYLDAVVDEMLRLAHTAITQDRQCNQDTVVLGHPIPKGTLVIIPNRGPSFTEPGYAINEDLRSPSCQAAAREHGVRAWADEEMDQFKPERWLVREEKGDEGYSATAGPTLPFGLGLRGCFGRKLAYLELRMITTLLVWSFNFQRCPESLSSYDDFEGLTRKPVQCYVSLKAR